MSHASMPIGGFYVVPYHHPKRRAEKRECHIWPDPFACMRHRMVAGCVEVSVPFC